MPTRDWKAEGVLIELPATRQKPYSPHTDQAAIVSGRSSDLIEAGLAMMSSKPSHNMALVIHVSLPGGHMHQDFRSKVVCLADRTSE